MTDYSRQRAYPGYTADDEYNSERERAETVLEFLEETLPDDVTAETTAEAGDPARTIVRYADDHGVDGIVLGSHGREGVARNLLGSVRKSSGVSSQSERVAFCRCGRKGRSARGRPGYGD